jgi:hypothetical protein
MMFDKENYIANLRTIAPNWSEQQLNDYAENMATKYATLKKGPNVVHLDYFGGLLDAEEIKTIEEQLAVASLELSRFDKSGIIYGNLQDYTLPIAFFIGPQVVAQLVSGLGPNMLWDAIKAVVTYTWRKWRGNSKLQGARQNFGIKLHTAEQHTLELKFEGDQSEETFLKSLDKVLKVLRQKPQRSPAQLSNFFVFDANQDEWVEVDVMAVLRRKAEEQAEARKTKES